MARLKSCPFKTSALSEFLSRQSKQKSEILSKQSKQKPRRVRGFFCGKNGKHSSVCEQFADHEADDEGDKKAAGTGEGKAEERFDHRLAGLTGEVATVRERFVGASKGQPEVEQEEKGQREEWDERPVVARTKGDELGENDHHEDGHEDEAGSCPVVIALDWGLLRHVQVFQVFRKEPKSSVSRNLLIVWSRTY
jgi:hypothetical protein